MILEHSEDEYRTPRARLFSLLMSLAMHAVLTLILWSLVYGINLPTSIQLTASLSDPNTATVSISETIQPADRSIVDAEEPATPTDSTVEYSLLEILASKDAKVVDHSIDSEEIQDGPDPISVVEFFGIRDIGTKFVFVVDISYSMQARNGERFQRAMSELVRAVSNLNPQQSYYVYLFSWRTHGMYYDQTSGPIPTRKQNSNDGSWTSISVPEQIPDARCHWQETWNPTRFFCCPMGNSIIPIHPSQKRDGFCPMARGPKRMLKMESQG